jgi:hypothetical protein
MKDLKTIIHRSRRLRSLLVSLTVAFMLLPAGVARAQQYTGMSGLLHVPSADMDSAATARVGFHALPEEMMPDAFRFEGNKYASTSWYLSYTPFRWIEVGYTFTLMKFHYNLDSSEPAGFYSKDRYFSLKIQPLRESEWWPSVALGSNDVWGQHDGASGSFYFRNFYLALSKHYDYQGFTLGGHLAYRYWEKDYNRKWNGIVGGVTLQHDFYKPLRLVGEFDGHSVNVGADCTVLDCLLLQASLQQCRYLSGGVCLYLKLK